MKTEKVTLILLNLVFLLGIYSSSLANEMELEKGKIVDKVLCQHNKTQGYALYLPSGYSGEKKWPIIYAFDPGAYAKVPLELFKDAAERFGYILVCSYNSQNGPNDQAIQAMKAIWQDTNVRFSLDKTRVYASGFSGGARICTFFSLVINNPVEGIIAVGAGLSPAITVEQFKVGSYLGIVGISDFNYQEMKKLDKTLDTTGIVHHIILYDGIHDWPPQVLCARALEWMEIRAMAKGLRTPDPAVIDKIFQDHQTHTQELEKSGDMLLTINNYESLLIAFNSLKDVSFIREKIAQISQSKPFVKFEKEEQKRLEKENEAIKKFMVIFAYIKQKNPGLSEIGSITTGLEIKKNLKAGQKKVDIYEKGVANRLLGVLGIKASTEGDDSYTKGDYIRAIIYYEIAAQSHIGTPWCKYDYYSLAIVYAKTNKENKALENLCLAVESGLKRRAAIEKDERLQSLHNFGKFKEIMELADQ